jgi:hypothetical protein
MMTIYIYRDYMEYCQDQLIELKRQKTEFKKEGKALYVYIDIVLSANYNVLFFSTFFFLYIKKICKTC